MKLNVTGKYKIWVLITVAVMIIGFVLFGIFGFNQKADYKACNTVSVQVDANIGGAGEVMEQVSKDYLSSEGLSYDRLEVLNNGGELVFFFNSSIEEDVDVNQLESAIKQAFNTEILSGLNVTVTVEETVNYNKNYAGAVAIAGGITLVVMFIYLFIMEKLAGAVACMATSVISGLIFFALMGLTRIPASPFILPMIVLASLFAGAYSAVIVNRFNSVAKTVSGEKANAFELADEQTMQGLVKCLFTTGAILVFGLIFIIMGSSLLKVLGLQAIVMAISSIFSAFAFTGLVWAGIKSHVKTNYVPAKSEDKE